MRTNEPSIVSRVSSSDWTINDWLNIMAIVDDEDEEEANCKSSFISGLSSRELKAMLAPKDAGNLTKMEREEEHGENRLPITMFWCPDRTKRPLR